MDPLRALARDAVAGDAGATRRLIEAVAPSVLRLARVVLGPARADAEDVAQESLLGFVAALGGFRGECSVLHYACRITVRTAVAARRRRRDRAQQAEEYSRTAASGGELLPGESVVAARRRALVRELLDELPEVQAEALAGLVARTLGGLGAAAGGARPAARRAGGIRWSRRLLVIAAILAVAAAAGAASWYLVLRPMLGGSATDTLRPAACGDAGPNEAGAVLRRVPEWLGEPGGASGGPRATARPPDSAPPPAAVPAAVGSVAPSQAPAVDPDVRGGVQGRAAPQRPSGAEPVEPRVPEAAEAVVTASEALLGATEARRAGEFAEAAALYVALQERFPGSREELLSRVTLGRLLLDRLGEPERALEQFAAYLGKAPNGTLAEDALVGRAIALGRLGRAEEERKAWKDLLARFPATAQSERARARLVELGESSP
ncbi:MAG: hypothetical protein HY905_27330 [Deltaproteobacteria bacterium]|nr:hypothetical protein [Deltaproteobacteria bacterium]